MRHHFILAEFFQAYDELTPTHVNDYLSLKNNISSLGNLKFVAKYLDLCKTNIISFRYLKYVGLFISCSGGEQHEKLKVENKGRFNLFPV